jgi:hypothetical protein
MSDAIFEPQNWQEKQAEERRCAREDWSDPVKVRKSRDLVLSSHVKQLLLGRTLAALVGKHCRKNVAILPPEWSTEDPPA